MAILRRNEDGKTASVDFEDREYHAIAMKVVLILDQQDHWIKRLVGKVKDLDKQTALKKTISCPECSALTSQEMLSWMQRQLDPPDSNCPVCGVFMGI